MSIAADPDTRKAIVSEAAKWLGAQPFTNVLLLIGLMMMAALAYWGIPLHLSQIQRGYEQIEKQQTEQLRSRDAEIGRAFDLLEKAINKP